jgi:hypothetical protein
MNSPEQLPSSAERNVEVSKHADERLEQLKSNVENAVERGGESQERKAERAQIEANELAISKERGGAEKDRREPVQAPRRKGAISRKEREQSFKRHMNRVQDHMSAPSRAFSKVIHNKVIEQTSDMVGSTVARPDAILSGAVAAFILTLGVYVVAKTLGFALSGFETIGAFAFGWILGTLYDYIKTLATGKP